MINFKINGVDTPIPSSWNDLTYGQYITWLESKGDITTLLANVLKMDKAKLQSAVITGLDKLFITLQFLHEEPHFDFTGKIGDYTIPKDVTIESLGQFEDLRAELNNVYGTFKIIAESREGAKDIYWQQSALLCESYAKGAAIYLQKEIDGQYDFKKAIDLDLSSYPVGDVIGNGAFFLTLPQNILKNITPSTPTTTLPQKKKKRDSQD